MREFDRGGAGHITEDAFHEGARCGRVRLSACLRLILECGRGIGWGRGRVPLGRRKPRPQRRAARHACRLTPPAPRPAGVQRWVDYKLRRCPLRREPKFQKRAARDPAGAAHQLLVHMDDGCAPLLAAD